jgi:hypothetical protein
MPGFIPTTNCVKVDAEGVLFGQQIDNTMWFLHRAGAPTIADLTDLGVRFNDFWEGNVVLHLSQDYAYKGCIVTDQSSESSPAVNVPVFGVSGTIAEDSMPGGTCLCITFLTAGRGRSSRGRNYISGIPKVQIIDNAVDGLYAGNFPVGYNSMFSHAINDNWMWVVVSHFTAGAPRAAGLPQEVISANLSDLNVDSQRRRLAGRGT